MSRVAVFGGAGFIGNCLVQKLLARGDEVWVLDDLFAGDTSFLPMDQIQFVKGSMLEPEAWSASFGEFDPQVTYNLAAIHFIPYCNRNPYRALEVNTLGHQRILEACKANSSSVVFASSAAFYGPSDLPHQETEPAAVCDIYGLTKIQGEQLGELWANDTKKPFRAARFFNVVGPRETNPHLLPEILHQSRTSDEILLGNIDTKRDYIFVEDIVSGLLAIESTMGDGKKMDAYNIGTGSEYSAREMVEAIAAAAGRPIQATSVPERYRPSDRPHLCADNSKLRAVGWKPENDFAVSMKKTWDDFVDSGQWLKPYPA